MTCRSVCFAETDLTIVPRCYVTQSFFKLLMEGHAVKTAQSWHKRYALRMSPEVILHEAVTAQCTVLSAVNTFGISFCTLDDTLHVGDGRHADAASALSWFYRRGTDLSFPKTRLEMTRCIQQ